jgi:SAM-dependent methyltransferase
MLSWTETNGGTRVTWRTKAAIQRALSRLPIGSEAVYYQLQRRFGNLRHPESPLTMFREAAAPIFAELRDYGCPVEGARVLEVGTGHRIHMPLAFYLAGADSIVTLDLHPILKRDLVMQSVAELTEHQDEVARLFQSVADPDGVSRRLRKLADAQSFQELARIMRLEYLSPADATATNLPDHSVDIHFSYTVFEHIPGQVSILREASRLVTKSGLICHHIDLSDHYSHADPSISKINFLRFSSEQWRSIDNDRFGYQNRLRADDYAEIYREAGQRILKWIDGVDPIALEGIRKGFPLAPEYQSVEASRLCTVFVRVISRALFP